MRKLLLMVMVISFSAMANSVSTSKTIKQLTKFSFEDFKKTSIRAYSDFSFVKSMNYANKLSSSRTVNDNKSVVIDETELYYVITNIVNFEYLALALKFTATDCSKAVLKKDETCTSNYSVKLVSPTSFIRDRHDFSFVPFNMSQVNHQSTLTCESSSTECELASKFEVSDLKLMSWLQRSAKLFGVVGIPTIEDVLSETKTQMKSFNINFAKATKL